MAKQCSYCGKTLTLRDSFQLKGKPICRNCLDRETGKISPAGDHAPSQGEKAETDREKEVARIYKQLKQGGIGSVLFGIINIVIGVATAGENPVNAVLAVLGFILLVEGIWLLASPRPAGLIVDGIALGILGIWNILITVHNLSEGSGRGSFLVYGIAQIYWGIQSFRRYNSIKAIAPELLKPGAAVSPVQETAAAFTAGEAADARSFHRLFDPGFSASNIRIGLFYFGAWIASTLISSVSGAIFNGRFFFMPAMIYVQTVFSVAAGAFLLCYLGYRIREMWRLALTFSVVRLLIIIVLNFFFAYVRNGSFSPASIFKPEIVINLLVWNFIIIGGLFYIVRRWGVKMWPFVIGMAAVELCGTVFSQILRIIFEKDASLPSNPDFYIGAVVNGAVFGAAMFLGFGLALKRRVKS